MENRTVEVTIEQKAHAMMLPGMGRGNDSMEFDFQGMLEKVLPKNVSRRQMTVTEARRVQSIAAVNGPGEVLALHGLRPGLRIVAAPIRRLARAQHLEHIPASAGGPSSRRSMAPGSTANPFRQVFPRAQGEDERHRP